VRCLIGVNAWEREDKQEVLINIALETDLREPGRTDHFEDAVDYRALKKDILAYAEASEHYLIEALAERVAEICLERQAVQRVTVTVDKPSALRFARSVAVEIVRGREEAR
jgi:FolB domain-containing protein